METEILVWIASHITNCVLSRIFDLLRLTYDPNVTQMCATSLTFHGNIMDKKREKKEREKEMEMKKE